MRGRGTSSCRTASAADFNLSRPARCIRYATSPIHHTSLVMVEIRNFHISWRLPHLTILFVANRLTNTRNRFDSKPLLAEGTGSPLRSSDTKTHAVAHSLTHAACRRPNDPSRRPAKHRTKSPPPSAGKATPRACHSFRFVLVRRVVCLLTIWGCRLLKSGTPHPTAQINQYGSGDIGPGPLLKEGARHIVRPSLHFLISGAVCGRFFFPFSAQPK